MSAQAALTLRNDLEELERLSQFVDDFAAQQSLPTRLAAQIKLALDEIVTNVISYAFGPHQEETIQVDASLDDAGILTLIVQDSGMPFDPRTVGDPDLGQSIEERDIGGLGIHLVRKVMDRLEYRRDDGRNVLVMSKQIAAS